MFFRFFTFGRYPQKYEASHLIEKPSHSFPVHLKFFSIFGYPVRNTGIEPLFVIFLALILFQIVPLPSSVVRLISPSAAFLYQTADSSFENRYFLTLSVDWFSTASKLCEYAAYFFLYLVTVNIAVRRRYFWILFLGLILSSTFQGFYGLYEALSGNGVILGYQKSSHLHVASGTFVNSNHFASYVVTIQVLMLSLATKVLTEIRLSGDTFLRALARLFQMRGSQLLLLFGLVILSMAAIVFSRSRACMVIAVLSCFTFFFLYWRANHEIPGKLYWLAAIIATIFIAVWLGINPLLKKFGDLPEDITSVTGRRQIWIDTLRMAVAFPVVGSGAGTYPQTFPIYQSVFHSTYSHAHNDLFEILAETGLFTLILCAIAFVRCTMRLNSIIKRRLEGLLVLQVGAACSLVAACLTSLAHFSFQIPAISITASFIAALFFLNCESKSRTQGKSEELRFVGSMGKV